MASHPLCCWLGGESSQFGPPTAGPWDLPDVISANPSLDAWTPTPAVSGLHLPVSSPRASAFPTLGTGRHLAFPRAATPARDSITGLQSFPNVQASRFARHPGRSYRSACSRWQPWLLPPSTVEIVTSLHVGYASRPNRAIDGRGLSPHKIRSLVGCSPNLRRNEGRKKQSRHSGFSRTP